MTGRVIAGGVELLVPVAAWVYLAVLQRRLRRVGRRDRRGELAVAFGAVMSLALAGVSVFWADRPGWVRPALGTVMLVALFGFMASRIREYPEAVFSPATAGRLRRWRLVRAVWFVPAGMDNCPRCRDQNWDAARQCITCTDGDDGYADGLFAAGWAPGAGETARRRFGRGAR